MEPLPETSAAFLQCSGSSLKCPACPVVFILQNLVTSMSTEKAKKREIIDSGQEELFPRLKYTHYKNQSKTLQPFCWNILSLMCPASKDGGSFLGGRRSLCLLLQSRNLSAGPCQKTMLQILSVANRARREGLFICLSLPCHTFLSLLPNGK